MQQGGSPQAHALVGIEADRRRNRLGEHRDPAAVACGERRLGIDHVSEGLRYVIEVGVIDDKGFLDTSLSQRHRLRAMIERRPHRGIASRPLESAHHGGVEPRPGAPPYFGDRRFAPACRMEHLDDLGKQRDARVQWDCLALQAQRPTSTIPVFVERGHGLCCIFSKAQATYDIGTAMAARLDHLLDHGRAVADDVENGAST